MKMARTSWRRKALGGKKTRRPVLEVLEDRVHPAAAVLVPATTLTQGYVGVVYDQHFAVKDGGGGFTYAVTGALPGGVTLDTRGELTGTPTQPGSFPITVTADNGTDTASQSYTLVVNPALTNPTLTFLQQGLPAGTVGTPYHQQITAQGGSGSYTYSLGVLVENTSKSTPTSSQYAVIDASLPTGLSLDPNTGVIGGTPTQAGVFNFVLQGNDGQGNFASEAYSLTVAPLISLTPTLAAGSVGSWYSQALGAQGGSGPYTYAVTAGGLPPGLALTVNGGVTSLSGTPAAWGKYGFTITATDSDGNTGSQAYALTVASPVSFSVYTGPTPPPRLGPAPVLPDSTSDYLAVVGVPCVQPIVEGNGGSFTYELTDAGQLPAGYTFSQTVVPSQTAVLTFTPAAATTYNFTAVGTDSGGNALPLSYSVVAYDPTDLGNPVPYGLAYGLPPATVGKDYDVTVVANGATSLAPSTTTLGGLTVTTIPASGASPPRVRITGRPTSATTAAVGPLDLTLTAQYVVNGTTTLATSQPLTLSVNPPAYGYAITPGVLPNAVVGSRYSARLTTQGGVGPFTFDLVSGPGWLTGAADGKLDGTPPAGSTGVMNAVVRVTDANGVVESRVLQLTVLPQQGYPTLALQSGLPALPLAAPGAAYSQTITATGAAPIVSLTYSLSTDEVGAISSLPSGLLISQPSQGGPLTIFGTPAPGMNTWSPVNVQVTATDALGHATTQTYILNVLNTPQQIRHAYGIDNVVLGGGVLGDGGGQTVAIVVGQDAPNLVGSDDPNFSASDLAQYDLLLGLNRYGRPGGPWFRKVDEFGGTNIPSPTSSSGSTAAGEITQDVEWVHALAPGANILLIEANTSDNDDFFTAFQTARDLGATVVSNSYGANENGQPPGVPGFDAFYLDPAAPPTTYFYAMSDPGGGAFVQYNAANWGAVAVSQTQLIVDGAGRYLSEQAVDGTGGAASVLELQPPWQKGVVDAVSTTMRATADVSFDGAISTGAAIYQTFGNSSVAYPWSDGNGSSLATPSWAAVMAIVNQGRQLSRQAPLSGPEVLTRLYGLAGGEDFHPITTLGSGGNDALINGGNGYDDSTSLAPAFARYSPWAGLGSPAANLLVPDLVGGKNAFGGRVYDAKTGAGRAGWTVYLDANGNGRLDANEARVTTGPDGRYGFLVAPGRYLVRVIVPEGWKRTTADPRLTFPAGKSATLTGVNVAVGRAAPDGLRYLRAQLDLARAVRRSLATPAGLRTANAVFLALFADARLVDAEEAARLVRDQSALARALWAWNARPASRTLGLAARIAALSAAVDGNPLSATRLGLRLGGYAHALAMP